VVASPAQSPASRHVSAFASEREKFESALVKTFPKLSPSAVSMVIHNANRLIGIPNSTVFNEGDMSTDMVFLFSGFFDVHKHGQRKAVIDSGSIVGHHAYLYRRPRSATVTVSSASQCIYYIFSIDLLTDTDVKKAGVWHSLSRATPAPSGSGGDERMTLAGDAQLTSAHSVSNCHHYPKDA